MDRYKLYCVIIFILLLFPAALWGLKDTVWAQAQEDKPVDWPELLQEAVNPPPLPIRGPEVAGFPSSPQIELRPFDNLYIGINDGNDGFGTDAGMACDDIDTSTSLVDPSPPGYTISNISLNLQLNHTWVGDLVFKLRSPDGRIATLMSRPGLAETADDGSECCGNNENILPGVAIAFDDQFPFDAEEMGDPAGTSGLNICSGNGRCVYHPNPDSAGTPLTLTDAFNGGNARGIWTLCIGDASELDYGNFSAWELFIEGTTPSTVGLQSIGAATAVANPLFASSAIFFVLLLGTLLVFRHQAP